MHFVRATFITTVLGLAALAQSAQAVPTTINYQGRLTDNTPSQLPLTGVFPMKFDLYLFPTIGGSLWTETKSVTVTGGIFSVELGSTSPIDVSLFGSPDRYLEITMNPGGSQQVLTPRQHLGAAAYADQSQNAALAVNATQLGAVASGSWQRALSPASCSGGFLTGVTQAGAASCAAVTSAAITPPLFFSTSSGSPLISAINGNGDGVIGQSGLDGTGVRGIASGTSGYGVWGDGGAGRGVVGNGGLYGLHGTATAASGATYGLFADATASPTGTGVYAQGQQTGGNFQVTGATGPGNAVLAQNAATSGLAIGVNATTESTSGIGVYGRARATSGVNYGVNGNSASASGFGGYFTNTGGGISLRADGANGPAGYFSITSAANPSDALTAITAGNGNAMQVTDSGNGDALQVTMSGAGSGGRFEILNGANSGDALVGSTNGSGFAGRFIGRLSVSSTLEVNTLGAAGATTLCRNASNIIATCSSSLRYKTNLKPFAGGLELLGRLKPITFDWKADQMHDVGFGAEDVAAVDPLFVTYNDRGQVEGVKYDRLNVVLVNGVRELQDQIKAQQGKIEAQQSEIAALKALVCADHPGAAACGAHR